MRSYRIKVGPDPVIGILLRRGKFGYGHAGRKPRDGGGRDWGDAPTSQGGPRITALSGVKREAGPPEESNPVYTLISDF